VSRFDTTISTHFSCLTENRKRRLHSFFARGAARTSAHRSNWSGKSRGTPPWCWRWAAEPWPLRSPFRSCTTLLTKWRAQGEEACGRSLEGMASPAARTKDRAPPQLSPTGGCGRPRGGRWPHQNYDLSKNHALPLLASFLFLPSRSYSHLRKKIIGFLTY